TLGTHRGPAAQRLGEAACGAAHYAGAYSCSARVVAARRLRSGVRGPAVAQNHPAADSGSFGVADSGRHGLAGRPCARGPRRSERRNEVCTRAVETTRGCRANLIDGNGVMPASLASPRKTKDIELFRRIKQLEASYRELIARLFE